MNYPLSRRRFLAGTLAASAVSPLVVPSAVLGKEGQLPPSERITIAVFGVGNRGRHSLGAMRPLPDHQVVAIAEARRDRGESGCQMTEEAASCTATSATSWRATTSMRSGEPFPTTGTAACTAA